MAVTLEANARNAACNGIVDLLDSGFVQIKTSTATTTYDNGEIATLTFSTTAFGAADAGVATANGITADSSATGGSAAKGVLYTSASAAVLSCSVGQGSGDISLTNTTIGEGDEVDITAMTVTVPAS